MKKKSQNSDKRHWTKIQVKDSNLVHCLFLDVVTVWVKEPVTADNDSSEIC